MLKSIEYMLKSMVTLKHTVWHDAFQHQDEKYLVHAESLVMLKITVQHDAFQHHHAEKYLVHADKHGDAENHCTT